MDRPLRLRGGVEIPLTEIQVEMSRSGGPGGQHVNKTETRVTVRFDVARSQCLSDRVRQKLLAKLGSRLTKNGEILVSADDHRYRARNHNDALVRLETILDQALFEEKPRRATKPTRGSKERRLSEKKRTGERKKARRDFE
ncbi:MAG: aminoacyl-tRNA hydrolase [Deltaproteobacteria bacterium]|jgi:ribosome-associated protein|nr:aminoacyl-tRNA hydrolase [Deltaproteobacteria bacterium]